MPELLVWCYEGQLLGFASSLAAKSRLMGQRGFAGSL